MKLIATIPYNQVNFKFITNHYDIHYSGTCIYNSNLCEFKSIPEFDEEGEWIKDDVEIYSLTENEKPYCIEIDSDGRKHFPNHVQVSFDTYNMISDNKLVADLILKDMTFHTIKSADLEEFVKNNDIKTLMTLLVTALCELHSNASMFGGITSDSFKIKFKQLDRRGKQLLNILK